MPYNFVAASFHRKKFCSRRSSRKVRFYIENSRFAFFETPEGLRGNVHSYNVHLRVTGKLVLDFYQC